MLVIQVDVGGALVLTKKRNKISDSLCEKLLMLKPNRNYW
jgi:hypothetical protein